MVKINPVQIQKFLKGVDYPAAKEDIVSKAKANDAPQDVIGMLEQLPDEQYESPTSLNEAIQPHNRE